MPKYPKKELAQLLLQACVTHGVEQVVISPGSRNAPLTLGFVSHPQVTTYSIVDERCAAFFALGLAQQSGKTVALLCTSGSALLNYYPAVAEAYYSNIPLLVISADRPKRLIDIGDGQTIRQEGVYANHIVDQSNLLTLEDRIGELANGISEKDKTEWMEENARRIDQTIASAMRLMGPVHINIPFDEPLYETVEQLYGFGGLIRGNQQLKPDRLLQEVPLEIEEIEPFSDLWNASGKKMVLVGSHFPDELVQTQMRHLLKDPSVIVLTETTSNLRDAGFINNIDQLIFPLDDHDFEQLRPEILITFGGMIVSKKIKQLFRAVPPKHHWHVDAYGALDTYHCLTHHFKISAQLFFSQFFFLTRVVDSGYQASWLSLKARRKRKHQSFMSEAVFSDLKVFECLFAGLPAHVNLQLANSSIIRYAQLFDLPTGIKVFCNRGTSGIDGSTSTAIGAAIMQSEQTVLITGDISFFYDSNALWNKYIPKDFRIILLNNSGGGIFRFIPGPKNSDALDFFETPHHLNAADLCKTFGIAYEAVMDEKSLQVSLTEFFKPTDRPILLEVFTPRETNDEVLKAYFKSLS